MQTWKYNMLCSESKFLHALSTSRPSSLFRCIHCYFLCILPEFSLYSQSYLYTFLMHMQGHCTHLCHLLISSQYSVLEIVPNKCICVWERSLVFTPLARSLLGMFQIFFGQWLIDVSSSPPEPPLPIICSKVCLWACIMKHIYECIYRIKFLPVKLLGHWVYIFLKFFLEVPYPN